MTYKAVIFDLFGTLVDNFSWRDHERVLTEMAVSLCVPRDAFQKIWITTFNQRATGILPTTESNILHICRILGATPDRTQIEAAVQTRVRFTRRTLIPRAGAIESLSALKRSGRKVGLISDCSSEVALLWDTTPFSGLIDEAILSCEVGFRKPDPRIYLLTCERLDVSPEDCLYVGDGSSRELTGAAKVGMSPVLIRVPYEDTYDAHRTDVDDWEGETISALCEVLRFVFDD